MTVSGQIIITKKSLRSIRRNLMRFTRFAHFFKFIAQYSLKFNEIYKFAHKWTFQKIILKTTPFVVDFLRAPIIKTVQATTIPWAGPERQICAPSGIVGVDASEVFKPESRARQNSKRLEIDVWCTGESGDAMVSISMTGFSRKETLPRTESKWKLKLKSHIQLTRLTKTFCWSPIARM